MDTKLRRILLALTITVVLVAIWQLGRLGAPTSVPPPPENLPADEANLPGAAGFEGATGWLNTPNGTAVDIVSLRGQVVLVDFWTYSCINCIHTLPHITKLYDTYQPYGFTVIGVHTPEFGFEQKRDNVAAAIEERGIHYPVPQDNDDSIWNGYSNHYWPAHYLVDQYGKIRQTHFGEGGYEETEQQVRALLEANGQTNLPPPIEPLGDVGNTPHSPELYASNGRSALGNPEGQKPGGDTTYAAQSTMSADRIYLTGTWHDDGESLTATDNGTVTVRFRGAGGNIVIDANGCFPVRLDGSPIQANRAGPVIDTARACLRTHGPDSYDFYAGPNEAHTVTFDVTPGFQLFTFDFTG